jgi:uncharacterized coiled-coil protein SlyX
MEDRITNVEVRIAFLEKTVEDLDAVVRELGSELVALRRAYEQLRDRAVPSSEPARTLEDDKPPHY